MNRFGLLGKKLGHSYSPMIHSMFADYEYKLYECNEDELEAFLKDGDWDGLNVTIPYKKSVVSYCDELSDTALKIGSVNTLLRRKDGSVFGDNTDAFGFSSMLFNANINVFGKKVLVLGSGGASASVCTVLKELNASQIVVVSRKGENNYSNLYLHKDAQIIVNTTPVGMYPNNGETLVSLEDFPLCEGVADIIYNPSKTALVLDAERHNINCADGLHMLVAQAKRSSEIFTDSKIDDSNISVVTQKLSKLMNNIILIGMPGSGKTVIAEKLGETLGRKVYDSDSLIEEAEGMSIPEIFEKHGEEYFRKSETDVISKLGKLSGAVISTGGGCIVRPENYPLMHQNGIIIWIKRDINCLAKKGRPISLKSNMSELYKNRRPLYEKFADFIVENNESIEDAVNRIQEMLK